MVDVTIIGAGNMGAALAAVATKGGHTAQVLARDVAKVTEAAPSAVAGVVGDPIESDVVILALPYPAVDHVLAAYAGKLEGKTVVDLTNPVDFATFDSLVVPEGSSAAAQIAAKIPGASVLKAFNTNFAATLHSGAVGGEQTTVLVAGDDAEAKNALENALGGGDIRFIDAGSLKRAHELESLGFLQLTLAAGEKTSWTNGFALAK